MPGDLYQYLATKNAVLVKFLDENVNFCGAIMKIVKMIVRICAEKHWSAPDLTFEVYSPQAADEVIILRIRNKSVL